MYLLYILIIAFSVIQSAQVKLYNRKNTDAINFNIVKSLSALVLFGLFSLSSFELHSPTAIQGILYGLFSAISMYSGYRALGLGPMSLTSMTVAFSVVIPLVYGVTFLDEQLNLFKYIGFILLIIAIIFTNVNKPASAGGNTNYTKWVIFTAATFLSNGICSILQKMHQSAYPGEYCTEFMLFAMIMCSLVFVCGGLVKSRPWHTLKNGTKYGSMAGIANAIVSFATIVLAGMENASVLFPAISAGTILGTLLCGVAVFKEKFRYNHFIALASGIAAVIFLKL